MIIKTRVAAAVAAVFLLGASAVAHAQSTLTVNVAGIKSFNEIGSSSNVHQSYNLGAGARITNIAYNVNISAFGPAWLSDIYVDVLNSAGHGVTLIPGDGDDMPGTSTYSLSASFNFALGADGLLNLEFYQNYDDPDVALDAIWNSGTIAFTYSPAAVTPVPEPGTYALMLAGLGALGWAARRRSA